MKKLKNYHPNGSLKPSADQHVGNLIINQTIKLNIEPRDNLVYKEMEYTFLSGKQYQSNNILVILESPHRFEYDACKNPIALVMGKTGCLFFEEFPKHLKNSVMKIRPGSYNLIISNAVQYQTSCGLNPIDRKIRNENWIEIYKELGGEEDFKKRVFLIKPKYTINLCTGGKNVSGLRHLVSESLDKWGLKKSKHYTEGNHPASWNMINQKNYRMIE